MFARLALCASLLVPAVGLAQTAPSGLVEDLFAAARFDGNLANLREAAIANWQETGLDVLGAGEDPVWVQATLDGNDPARIATDFRRGFLSVPFSAADMHIAIAELNTPFGQRLTRIGIDMADRVRMADTLAGDFAAAELTNSPRVVAADRVLELRGSIETYFAFRRASEAAYFLGVNGEEIADALLPDHVDEDLQAYMADWDAYFGEIREDVTLSFRETFFLVTDGFTQEEVNAWVTRAEQPWAQAIEAGFQAGYLEAYRQSMFRQGQAVAAFEAAQENDG